MNRYSVPATASLERLDCFRVARDFARLAQRLPIANAALRDQFRRASLSVLTNVAEGAGRVAKADKRRCYANFASNLRESQWLERASEMGSACFQSANPTIDARGEACESAALLDIIDDAPTEIGELLSRVIAMLTMLAR